MFFVMMKLLIVLSLSTMFVYLVITSLKLKPKLFIKQITETQKAHEHKRQKPMHPVLWVTP